MTLLMMKFTETPLRGAFVLELEPHRDERGFFARTFCAREFEQHGLNPRFVQCSVSTNLRAGSPARHALAGRPTRRVQAWYGVFRVQFMMSSSISGQPRRPATSGTELNSQRPTTARFSFRMGRTWFSDAG